MLRKYARRGTKGFIGYICKTYKTQGKQFCDSHSILFSIKNEAKKILNEEDIDELKKMEVYNDSRECYEMQLDGIQKRIDKIEKFKRKTYGNFMEDLISKEEYMELNAQYDEWVEAFKNYINIRKLTRDMVLELIERIEVNIDGSIIIYYKFQNPYG